MVRSLLSLSAAALLGLALLPADASADEAGARTFTTYCGTCHGAEGKGDGAAAAGLDPKPANFHEKAFWEGKTDDYLTRVIKEGGAAVGKSPLMTAWGAVLSDEQVKQVVDYIKTLKPKE